MNRSIFSAELQAIKNLRLLSEQEDDEYYRISPEEVVKLLDYAYNSGAVLRLPKFKGKKLYVTGDLKLSNRKELTHLGNIAYVDGILDISNTGISDLSGVTVKRYTWDSGTPIEQKRIKKELEEKKEIANERRQEKEWHLNNPNIDEIGLKANALYKYFIENGKVEEMFYEEEYNEIKSKINELNKKAEETEDMKEYSSILDEISDLEDKLEGLGPKFDVYDIAPEKYKHYGNLKRFEVLHPDHRNEEYTVGTYDEMEDAAIDYAKNTIDEIGLDGFNQSFIERYIDEDAVKSMLEEHYYDSVRDSPESYFDKSDYELTKEQEDRIEELQNYIDELEDYIKEKEDEQGNIESEIEDPQEYTKAWDEIQNLINDAEKKKDDAQEELDGIEPDKEPTTQMIEDKVQELIDDDMDNVPRTLRNFGLELKEYVDLDELAKGYVESDGWGIMNGYDGNYEYVKVNDKDFYVMRLN